MIVSCAHPKPVLLHERGLVAKYLSHVRCLLERSRIVVLSWTAFRGIPGGNNTHTYRVSDEEDLVRERAVEGTLEALCRTDGPVRAPLPGDGEQGTD